MRRSEARDRESKRARPESTGDAEPIRDVPGRSGEGPPIGEMLLSDRAVEPGLLEVALQRQDALGRRKLGEILVGRNHCSPEDVDRALHSQHRRRARLGEVLVEAQVVTPEDVAAALAEQRRQGGRVGDILVEMGAITSVTLARTLARKFQLPFVDLDESPVDPAAALLIPRWIVEKHRILPIAAEHGGITIALSDPLNTEPLDLIRFHGHEEIREVVAVPEQLDDRITRLAASEEEVSGIGPLSPAIGEAGQAPRGFEEDDPVEASGGVGESDSAVIQLANQILLEALKRGASDIHIEPKRENGGVGVRFRIDGACQHFTDVPDSHRLALISRIKIMADLDISERRKPQDGRTRVRLPGRVVDLRVTTVPTHGGEDLVLRVLAASEPVPIDEMDLDPRNRRELERLIRMPYGLVLCAGPTGSGKTTSLHALIGAINTPDRKIWTAEDPVEITQAGLRQVVLQPKIGFGFAEALRALLRADPDVIMVGEMRDAETAAIAIRASLTGHLVLSTLHTNSAPDTVERLIDMGADPLVFGDALLCVLAQRLARRLCEACKSLEPTLDEDRESLRSALGPLSETTPVRSLQWRARGCEECRMSGYRGRIALHEVLVVDERLRSAIHARAGVEKIRAAAVEGGMTTLLQDGAMKCLAGITDLSQVLAVCAR